MTNLMRTHYHSPHAGVALPFIAPCPGCGRDVEWRATRTASGEYQAIRYDIRCDCHREVS